jgi:hypothetical protein
MVSWGEFTEQAADLAATVQGCFAGRKHCTMASLRRDGSPRISGTEVEFVDGEVRLGMMARSMKALDLLRDPRVAVHSPTVDPPETDPGAWVGEAKFAGTAVEVPHDGEDGSHRFRIDITEVVYTRVGEPADHLVIESWHADRGLHRRKRY